MYLYNNICVAPARPTDRPAINVLILFLFSFPFFFFHPLAECRNLVGASPVSGGSFFFFTNPPFFFFVVWSIPEKKTFPLSLFRDSIFHNDRRTKSRNKPPQPHTLLVFISCPFLSLAFPPPLSPPPRPSCLSLFSLPPLTPYHPLQHTQPISIHQNNQTHEKTPITANINTIQTFHPTPVRSAIRSMRFIVPLSRTRVLSKLSFIFSARVVELVISADMASDIYIYVLPFERGTKNN